MLGASGKQPKSGETVALGVMGTRSVGLKKESRLGYTRLGGQMEKK